MAVYTQLSRKQIETFLASYDCGELVDFEGIEQGVENTNYKIETTQDKFILTLFEKRTNEADLPFFFDFMNHLHSRLVYCPLVMAGRKGEFIRHIARKPASLISFLEGRNIAATEITAQMCFETGVLLGRMHEAAADFKQTRVNSMSLSAWRDLYRKILEKQDRSDLIEEELILADETFTLDLPKSVVHADLFPDNVFMRDGKVEGAIDFYFSSTDYLVYDLAITVNAWCFENGVMNRDRFDAMIAGYETVRKLLPTEKAAFQAMARAAALRILMTRTHDWLFHDASAIVKPKSPLEYKQILEFHRHEHCFS